MEDTISNKCKKCECCDYSDIMDWDQDKRTGKATPIYWCDRHKRFCEDIKECEYK